MSGSDWRKRARIVIRDALDSVPQNATERQIRAILREVYPFGLREHHPYRMWLAEVREALRRRCLGMSCPPDGPRVLCLPSGVVCSWCQGKRCLICGPARARHAETNWQGWDRVVLDAETRLVLADWLEEHGFDAEATYYREQA